MTKIRTIEMFAGVGGFRVGLSRASDAFRFVWANQWEPGTKRQPSWACYERNFGAGSCLNADISSVDVANIPEFDLLTAGFPCQDYSVAKSLKDAHGLEGKKGVLWWDIRRVIEAKKPKFVLLENVDRLLSSPAGRRGRDFAVMLRCLMDLNYAVEWRVVNAASYGGPQRRKRVFIFATTLQGFDGLLGKAFPFDSVGGERTFRLDSDVVTTAATFGETKGPSPFGQHGTAADGEVRTHKVHDQVETGPVLGDILIPESEVPASFVVTADRLDVWKPFKLGRSLVRRAKNGHEYTYSEGRMAFPDGLDKPGRTLVTGEGGPTPSRFKHIVEVGGRWRRLTPTELERLNMFADGHTAGFTDVQRAFMMGNALVVGVVTRIGKALADHIKVAKRSGGLA